MNTLYFRNIEGVGDLYLDHVFYEFEGEPILFTCYEKEKREIYLSICSEIRFEQRWILVKSTVDLLISLVEKKIDIAQAFLQADEAIQVTMDLEGNEKSVIKSLREIDRLDLPEEGTWIRCDEEAALAYLREKEPIGSLKELMRTDGSMNENRGYRISLNSMDSSHFPAMPVRYTMSQGKQSKSEFTGTPTDFPQRSFTVSFTVCLEDKKTLYHREENSFDYDDISGKNRILQLQTA